MSKPEKEARSWFARQDQVWSLEGITSTERLVLLALCRYANGKGAAWPKVARLASDTVLGRRTVQKTLSGLVEKGLLTRPEHAGNLSEGTPNRYGATTYVLALKGRTRCAPQSPNPEVSGAHEVRPLRGAPDAPQRFQGRTRGAPGAHQVRPRGAPGAPLTVHGTVQGTEKGARAETHGARNRASEPKQPKLPRSVPPKHAASEPRKNSDAAPPPPPKASGSHCLPSRGPESPSKPDHAQKAPAPHEHPTESVWLAYWAEEGPLPDPSMLDRAFDACCDWVKAARGRAISPTRNEHVKLRKFVIGECVEDEGQLRASVIPEAVARLNGTKPGKSSLPYLLGFVRTEITEVLVPAPERDTRSDWEREEDRDFAEAMRILRGETSQDTQDTGEGKQQGD